MRSFVAAVAFAVLATTLPLAPAGAASRFDKADTNHDGRITPGEFEAFAGSRLMASSGKAAQKFKQLGPDRQAATLQRRFEKLDRDHKGFLTRADFDAARSRHHRPSGPSGQL